MRPRIGCGDFNSHILERAAVRPDDTSCNVAVRPQRKVLLRTGANVRDLDAAPRRVRRVSLRQIDMYLIRTGRQSSEFVSASCRPYRLRWTSTSQMNGR